MQTRGNRSTVLAALFLTLAILTVSTSTAASQNADPRDGAEGVVLGSGAAAPQAMLAPDPPLLGTGVVHFGAEAFRPYSQSYTWTRNSSLMLYATSVGNNAFDAPVVLPNGVTVNQVVFYYFDNDVSADASLYWVTVPSNSAGGMAVPGVFTSGASADIRYAAMTAFPDAIDNGSNNYFVRANLPGGANVALKSVRIDYSYKTVLPLIQK